VPTDLQVVVVLSTHAGRRLAPRSRRRHETAPVFRGDGSWTSPGNGHHAAVPGSSRAPWTNGKRGWAIARFTPAAVSGPTTWCPLDSSAGIGPRHASLCPGHQEVHGRPSRQSVA